MKNIIIIISLLVLSPFAMGQQLQNYIDEAHSNNPNIQAYELRYNIAREKVNETNWLPNTEFGVGYFVSEPETRTGAQVARFSAKQMLPWFGTITTRRQYADKMAETDYVDYMIAKRKLALAVALSYYELYHLQASQGILDENIELLEVFEELALSSVEVGKASAVDVLKLQIRQNELGRQKEILKEKYKGEQVKFNGLLNRDLGFTINVVAEINVPDSDPTVTDSLELNPELLRFDKLFESVEQEELINQKESAPMLGLGLDYIPVQERSGLSFSDNGKDIIMPMVSVSIPLFNKKYTSRTKQNDLRMQEIKYKKQDRLNMLKSSFAKAVSNRNQARIIFNTQEENLKQAKDAEQILIKSYETGTIDFNDVLDIQELQLKFQLSQIKSVQMYYTQSAIINYLVNN